jgi:ribosome-associated translation inhibitor RaiA
LNIHLESQGFETTPAIKEHVLRQLRFNLANFEAHILSVKVFLRDLNGPKGGVDMKALIHIKLETRQSIKVESTRSDLYAAIVIAARQAKRAVRRSLSKHRRMEKLALRQMRQFPQF